MGSLTPADVKRWDLNAIHTVFETATGRADTLQRLGDSLQQPITFWPIGKVKVGMLFAPTRARFAAT